MQGSLNREFNATVTYHAAVEKDLHYLKAPFVNS